MNRHAPPRRMLLGPLVWLSLCVLALAASAAPEEATTDRTPAPAQAPAKPTGNDADAAIREALEKLCQQEGKHWDETRRECVYLMRSKD